VVVVLALATGGFVAWALSVPPIMPEATRHCSGDETVQVTQGRWIAFEPATPTRTTGVIFYPGGRVDARALRALDALPSRKWLSRFIVPVTLNLALFSPNVAQPVIEAYPQIEQWVVGGHVAGGLPPVNLQAVTP
jgi:hypothetical protein